MIQRLSLRHVAPLFGVLALLLALQAQSVGAGIGWCSRDPIFELGGRRGHVYVEAPETMLDVANGPVRVDITVPKGVPVELLDTDDGFGWKPDPYDVRFHEHNEWVIENDRKDKNGDGYPSQFKIRIEVRAPTSLPTPLPVRVRFVTNDGTETIADGLSDNAVVVRSYL